MKKILTVLMVCLFAYGAFAAGIGLAPSNGKYSYTKAAAYNGTGITSVKTKIYNETADAQTVKGGTFPAAFNLRDDLGWICPVKDMYPYYNSSWATSAADVISFSEASKTGVNTLEVSALNMITKNPYGNLLETGGTFLEAMAYLHGTLGPVAEKDDPWKEPYTSSLVQPKRIGAVDNVQIIDDGKPGFTLNEISKIKNAVYNENRALQVSFYFDDQYLYKGLSYYCPEADKTPNMFATVVGWDDNYDRAYFSPKGPGQLLPDYDDSYLPKEPGAFLVKCSFGSEWAAAEKGYIWISYEEASLLNLVYYDYNTLSDLNYESVMTYLKGCALATSINGFQKGSVYFYPENAGEISGFRIYYVKNLMSNIEIYINGESVGYSLDFEPEYPGYASVMLENYDQSPITFNKGDEIQVIVNFDPKGPNYWGGIIEGIPIAIETEYNGLQPDIYPYTSFISDYKNRWTDVSTIGNLGISLLTNIVYDVISIEADPAELTLTPDEKAQIKTTVYPKEAKDKRLKWKSSNTSVAEVNNGVVTAKKIGKALITVSSVQNPDVKATVKVTVKDSTVHVSKVAILGASTVNVGKTLSLEAVITPSDATVKDVIWESSDESIAEVDMFGNVYGKKAGKVSVKATSVDNPKAYAIKKITVKKIPVESVVIKGSATKVNVGETISFDAIVSPADATNKDVKWASSNKKIATVDSDGNVYGIKAGKVSIKAASADNSKIYDIVDITVVEVTVNKIIVPESLVLKEGEQKQITAKVLPENAKNKNVKYKLSNTKYASVSADGTVKALKFSDSAKEGKVTLRVYSAVNSKVYADCKITVVHAVKDIKVPSKIAVNKGSKYSVNAAVVPSTAYNTELLWKSGNNSVATVSADGVITAKKVGKCYIYVKSADNPEIVKSIKLDVTEPVEKIEIQEKYYTTRSNKFRIDYKVLPEGAYNKDVIWTSSNPKIVKVADSKKGNLQSLKVAGHVYITVTSVENPSISAKCKVIVE